jgi:maleylacetoacetate isomerase
MSELVLYDYWRSSASYRVRIALALKGVSYERVPVDLVAGDQKGEAYKVVGPQGLVPALDVGGGVRIVQSLAIIDWIEAIHAEPPLLPADPVDRSHVMALALAVACDIHPLNNLRVLKHLGALGLDEGARAGWYAHWVHEGLAGLEALAAPRAGRFLFGDAPTLADVCLVPQMYNARRFDVDVSDFPTLVRADAAANALDAFAAAHPDRVAPA